MQWTDRDVQRFWSKVQGGEYTECWPWQGYLQPLGYGRFSTGNRTTRTYRAAHQCAYVLMIGEVPQGLQLDHLCRNARCVNPWHLEPVTPLINTRRGVQPQRTGAFNRAKTHCPRGHEYTEGNTEWTKQSRGSGMARNCRTCRREAKRARYALKRAGS